MYPEITDSTRITARCIRRLPILRNNCPLYTEITDSAREPDILMDKRHAKKKHVCCILGSLCLAIHGNIG